MKKQKFTLGLTAFAVLLIISFQSTATVWRINNEPNNRFIQSPALNGSACAHCFSDITTALTSLQVHDYDTLHIEATPYNYGIITINRPITFIGAGYYLSQNQNAGLQFNTQNSIIQALVINAAAHGSTFEGLYILPSGSGGAGIFIDADTITIKRCFFYGLTFTNFTARTNITITQCYGGDIGQANTQNASINNLTITNNHLGGVTLYQHIGIFSQNIVANGVNGLSGMTYENNIFTGGYILQNINNTINNVRNNTFVPGTYWFTGLSGNTNETEQMTNVFTTPSFTYDADLMTNSITCTTCNHGFPWNGSGTGTLKGVFGGTTPYVLGGIANIPTIYNLNVFSPINQGGNTPVNISTRSNNKN